MPDPVDDAILAAVKSYPRLETHPSPATAPDAAKPLAGGDRPRPGVGGGYLPPMALLLLLVGLFLSSPLAAQHRGEDEEPPPMTEPAEVAVDERSLGISSAWTPGGTLFEVEPLVELLGGELRMDPSGEGWFLELEGTEIAFGPGSDDITRDKEIVGLSRAPAVSAEGRVLAPIDFFEQTYGALLGYGFEWDEGSRRLRVRQAAEEELPLSLDLVHLQGVTTVVLQFPREPRYRVEEIPGGVALELVAARLPRTEWGRRPVDDPLVREIDVQPGRIQLLLHPGVEAESYTLDLPFRVVFDVHRAARAGAGAAGELRPPTPRRGIRTIVLDPGHGGDETGAIGPSGVAEKDLTLLLARTLEARLQQRLPVRVVLTRDEDVELPLATRTAIANQNKADLFLSIHLNSAAGGNGHARGAETYFLSLQASDERAARAAEVENRVDPEGPVPDLEAAGGAGSDGEGDPLYDLQLILWDLAQSHHLAESQRLARLIQEELNGALSLRDRGVKQAPFRVLMGAAMPAVLVELGFLSNPEEEARLQDPAYRAQLADALVRAISRYRSLVENRSLPTASSGDDGPKPGSGEPAAPGGAEGAP